MMTLRAGLTFPERVVAPSHVKVETTVDCPFSLVLDEADHIFELVRSSGPEVRIAFRDMGLPFSGGFARRVITRSKWQPDLTERGREHDEVVFEWDARSRLLPTFRGTMRFRVGSISQTRVIIEGSYLPPLGRFGRLFDRLIGEKLARVTLKSSLRHLKCGLEAFWLAEQDTQRLRSFERPA